MPNPDPQGSINAFDLEFRDEMELASAEVDRGVVSEALDRLDLRLSAVFVPGVTPDEAARLIATLSTSEQVEAVAWVSEHFGGMFAGQVARSVAARPSVDVRMGETVGEKGAKRTGEPPGDDRAASSSTETERTGRSAEPAREAGQN